MRQNHLNGLRLWHVLGLALAFTIIGCDGCDGPDKIIFQNQSSHQTGFLVDGADASGEFMDETFKTSDPEFEFTEDLISRSDGKGEVVAFCKRRPPFARNPINWHEGFDLVSIPFEDEIRLNFTVWIVDVNWANGVTNRTNETLDALAYAEERWKEERVGLLCGDIRVVDRTNDPDAKGLRDCSSCPDSYFQDLKDDIGFDEGRMNIYLTRKANDSWGRYYGRVNDIGGDQIIMGMYTGSEDLLMHEIAHNLTLEHVDNNTANFDNKNVATSSGGAFTKRKYYTEGQTFRCHFDDDSALNDTYNARNGLFVTECPHSTSTTVDCPKVQKRIWSDDSNWPAN